MAGDRSSKKAKDKWKEKKWYTILAPNQIGGKEIGTTIGANESEIIGRTIEVPISDLSGNFKRTNSKVVFKIVNVSGLKCSTMFIGHYVGDDYIRRLVRRGRERIDIIEKIKTVDNYVFSLKIVAITDGNITSSKRIEVRNKILESVYDKTKNMDMFEFIRYVISEESLNEIINNLKEVYPVKKIEFRKSELLETGKEYNFLPEEQEAKVEA
ncbi:30S ribosomal protein S3ae [Caldiplasma sukawensis]